MQYVRHATQKFDVIIVDLVDPANDRMARLYSTDFYRETSKVLDKGGIFITQATSTYFTPNAVWVIHNNVSVVFGASTVLFTNVPSFGEWGFIASANLHRPEVRPLPETDFVTKGTLAQSMQIPDSLIKTRHGTISSILSPSLHIIYNKDMSRWSY